ncbi:MAG: PDZ domain-containing protein, partial [Planctomycetia bacterium]
PGSPAAAAGLQVGDVLTAVDGVPVTKSVDFSIGLLGRSPGDRLLVSIRRQGADYSAALVLAEKPKPDGARLALDKFGLELQPLTAAVGRKLGLKMPDGPAEGLVVTKVAEGGPAAAVGIEPADILAAVGRHTPDSLDDLGLLLEEATAGRIVPVDLIRVTNQGIYRIRAGLTVR